MRTCDRPNCDKKHVAKGLCSTHYNQTLPTRYAKVLLPCDGCGTQVPKESRARRYKWVICSDLCRYWVQWGPWSCDIPVRREQPIRPPIARVQPVPKRQHTCIWCEAEFLSHQSLARYCSKRCSKKYHKVERRALERGAAGSYTWAQIVRLWVLFDKRCAYCEQPTDMTDIQAEHVHPLSRGGRNDIGNLLPACAPCNRDKRDVLLHEWNADRARRNLPPVTTSWQHGDNRAAHLVIVRPLTH